ncbi:hypothetical protein GF336_01320 [Candidatus Woesearchaeota archaeon]|nr:hypothetical protein [Candidatus Woesearchaeota archaeon]
MTWKIEEVEKTPKLKDPVLIEGMPGIGNVGKVAVDFLIDELDAKKIYELFSYTFPHSVFVNEENMVELPKIEIYHANFKGKDILLLAGDVQPIDEVSCYEFCEELLKIFRKLKGKEIITLGGIGLQNIPKKPKVYCTGNEKKMIKTYCEGTKASNDLKGVVGPIVGVSGLLLGLAGKEDIPAISLLSETFGHPMYLGVKGAREILKILNMKMDLGIDLKDLDKEIKKLEEDMMKKTEELTDVSKTTAINKVKNKFGKETSYIG